MKHYDIKIIDQMSASKEKWASIHNFRRNIMSEISPGDPVQDDASYEEWVKLDFDQAEIQSCAVTLKEDPSEIIAWLRMGVLKKTSPSYDGNKHILRLRGPSVLRKHRRKGIGLAIAKLIHGFAVEKEKRIIIGGTVDEGGRAFNRLIGGVEALEMRDSRLNMDDVDWNMVEKWEQEGAERSPDTALEFCTSIPEGLLENYCKKYTEVMNQMPLDELDVGDQIFTPELWRKLEETSTKTGETWLTAMLREKNGDISGLSDVIYHPSKAPLLSQQLTGVDQNYRGQGKGKWVKAAMLLKVRKEFPDIKSVFTGNATSNAPMLSINERMGFKLYREMFSLQVETEKLGKYLESKQ